MVEARPAALNDKDALVRNWGAISCSAADSLTDGLIEALTTMLGSDSEANKIESAGALARHGQTQHAYQTLIRLLGDSDTTVNLHAARTIELAGDPVHRKPMQSLFDRFENEPSDIAWFIRFTTTGYLNRLP